MVACHVNGNVLALWHIEAGYIRYQWVWRIVPACQHELWRDRDVTARNRLSIIPACQRELWPHSPSASSIKGHMKIANTVPTMNTRPATCPNAVSCMPMMASAILLSKVHVMLSHPSIYPPVAPCYSWPVISVYPKPIWLST